MNPQQPTNYVPGINLNTAKTLGPTIPQSCGCVPMTVISWIVARLVAPSRSICAIAG